VAGQQVPAAPTFKYEVIIARPMTLAGNMNRESVLGAAKQRCEQMFGPGSVAAQWSEWLARFSMTRKLAKTYIGAADPVRYTADGGTYLERSLTGVRWLQSHGCDCEEGLAATQSSVETYLDSPDRQKALAAIAELRKKQ